MQQTYSPDEQTTESSLVVSEESKPTVCNVAQKLVMLSSFAKELQTQAHLIHFNYEAPNFFSVHRFLKMQYDAHQAQFDKLGEFVRTLNYWMPMCSCGLHDALPSFKKVESYNGREMLSIYYQNLNDYGKLIKMIEPAAHESGAIDIAHYLDELCSDTYKATWMIKATIS
jgi:DNA-binding ferritin-like protein|tara:strand:+ start:1131 stop:1640 length:510 start_codon:yes stop_codon:yes gene_type:complete